MKRQIRRASYVAAILAVAYGLTWVVAQRTLVRQLRESMVDDAQRFFEENPYYSSEHPGESVSELRSKLAKAMEETDFHLELTRVVPVLPGVVIAWYEMWGKFHRGGDAGFGGNAVCVRFVYGAGSYSLYSRTLDWGP